MTSNDLRRPQNQNVLTLARYHEETVNFKRAALNDDNGGLVITEDPRLTCYSENVVSETAIKEGQKYSK